MLEVLRAGLVLIGWSLEKQFWKWLQGYGSSVWTLLLFNIQSNFYNYTFPVNLTLHLQSCNVAVKWRSLHICTFSYHIMPVSVCKMSLLNTCCWFQLIPPTPMIPCPSQGSGGPNSVFWPEASELLHLHLQRADVSFTTSIQMINNSSFTLVDQPQYLQSN